MRSLLTKSAPGLGMFAAGLAMFAACPAYSQELGGIAGGIGTGGIGMAGAMVGPGGMISSRGDNNATTFTYNFPKGAMVFSVTGAPYAGRTSSQTVRTLANGTHLTQQSFDQPMTYRDALGRTRTELTMSRAPDTPNGAKIQPQIMRLADIVDPVAGYEYILDHVHQVAHRVVIQARQNQAQARAGAVAGARMVQPAERTMPNGQIVKNEDLGTQTMFGISVVGQRNTTTYPIGTFQGNDQPVVMVNESWRSVQYGLVLQSKNTGVNGDTTTTMKDFSKEEPDPTLFMVPAGYQVVDETGEFTITIPRAAQ